MVRVTFFSVGCSGTNDVREREGALAARLKFSLLLLLLFYKKQRNVHMKVFIILKLSVRNNKKVFTYILKNCIIYL